MAVVSLSSARTGFERRAGHASEQTDLRKAGFRILAVRPTIVASEQHLDNTGESHAWRAYGQDGRHHADLLERKVAVDELDLSCVDVGFLETRKDF